MNRTARSLIKAISRCRSVAVSGMSKNAGKTESLNFIIEGLRTLGVRIGVTSIGTDGETVDRVTATPKPEISIYPGTLFATAESDYRHRSLVSEVEGVGTRQTPIGRIVMANALSFGKVVLSGPSDIPSLKETISEMQRLGAETVLVDGALFRQSLASPAVTEGMVLATGAAVSRTVKGVVDTVGRIAYLLTLPIAGFPDSTTPFGVPSGLYAIEDGRLVSLGIQSGLALAANADKVFSRGSYLFLNGALTDRILDWLAAGKRIKQTVLVVPDFTRIFATMQSLRRFSSAGGKLMVAAAPMLLAVTVNPTSPEGYRLDSDALIQGVEEILLRYDLDVPVIDVRKQQLNIDKEFLDYH